MIVQRLPANERGRDFVVGDIHAAVTRLRERLEAIGFDADRDRLLCVGDLVDRGPEPHLVPGLLAEPWFHAVRGNHDVSVLHALGREGSPAGLPYQCEDHHWIHELSADAAEALLDGLQALPWALEVDTLEGTVGVVHAEVPPECPTWAEFVDAMADPDMGEAVRHQAIWSREIAGRARGRGTARGAHPSAARCAPGVPWPYPDARAIGAPGGQSLLDRDRRSADLTPCPFRRPAGHDSRSSISVPRGDRQACSPRRASAGAR
ncbi:MAG: metallophosphoesterase [Arhodomonas sp.]|nr:metallophosphoesterase [Arhodomonas sp.]